MAGAGDAPALVEAVEGLRGVVWETLLEELCRPLFEHAHARRVAEVCDRLACVCASALAAALAEGLPERDRAGADAQPPPAAEPPAAAVDAEGRRASEAVIVDEHAQVPVAPRRAPAEIEIRDERGEVGPAAWIGSIGRQLERFRRDGGSFAVLLLELRDIERLRRDGGPEELSQLVDQVEQVLASELRPAAWPAPGTGEDGQAGSLTRERPGRYWLLAPETDRIGVRVLAERLIGAVRRLSDQRGSFLELAIGMAVCPEDGREAAALAAHADLELYAARSSARTAASRPPASVDETVQ